MSQSRAASSIARVAMAAVVAFGFVVVQPSTSFAAGVTIRIGDSYSPDSLTVAPGTKVTWVNESDERHRVRTTSGPTEFDSGNLEPGERFSVTLRATGTYQYNDHREEDDRSY
ncbi:MAG TPA: plastocyanin/azurin family copper-binding protein, partial [Candidatus Saccharimonadales bacterium]|nr:plastocyanin/azurin family copper-binding protein [Candidatus Saccharimonadales bacterium]